MQQEHTESHCRWSVVNNIRKYNTICKLHISISIDIDISISLHTHTHTHDTVAAKQVIVVTVFVESLYQQRMP